MNGKCQDSSLEQIINYDIIHKEKQNIPVELLITYS